MSATRTRAGEFIRRCAPLALASLAWSGNALALDTVPDGGLPDATAPDVSPPPGAFDHGPGNCPLYTGGGFPAGGHTQVGQIVPGTGNDASRCKVPNLPLETRATDQRFEYTAHLFENRSRETACISVSVSLYIGPSLNGYFSGGAIQVAAYFGQFIPDDVTRNYLGDVREVMYKRPEYPPQTENVLRAFSFEVPPMGDFVVVVSEAPEATGPSSYDLTVKGCGTHVVTSVTPSSGPASGGTTVTIKGSGFDGNAPPIVEIGHEVKSVTVLDEGTMSVVTDANPPGTYDVAVTNHATGEWLNTSTLPQAFTYIAGPSQPTSSAAADEPPAAASQPPSPSTASFAAPASGVQAENAASCSSSTASTSPLTIVGIAVAALTAALRRRRSRR